MKDKPDEEHFIPLIDCPECGAKDQPASHSGPWVKGKKEVHIWSCPNCDAVLNLENDLKPKGWISIRELEAMGWSKVEKGAG